MPNGTTNNKDISHVNGAFAGWTASDVFGSAPEMAEMIKAIYGPDPRIARGDYAELMRNASDWYGYSTFSLNSRTGQPSTSKYGIAYGHLGATYGYQSIMAYLSGFDIALVVATNIETQDQLQPADAFCFAYQAIAGLYTSKDLNCSFGNAGTTLVAAIVTALKRSGLLSSFSQRNSFFLCLFWNSITTSTPVMCLERIGSWSLMAAMSRCVTK